MDKMCKKISVIGGDLRQIYAAKNLMEQGYDVKMYGFGEVSLDGLSEVSDFSQATHGADCVLLPLPVTRDKMTLNMPLCQQKLPLSELFSGISNHTTVFCGMAEKLPDCYRELVVDYAKDESFLLKNAYLTAEAAVEIAIANMPISLYQASVLVTGYGRIGIFLARMLHALGARTYVASRQQAHLVMAELEGHIPIAYSDLFHYLPKMDVIFNTVPAQIFDHHFIGQISKKCLVTDLASLPGGIDRDAAKKRGISVLHALSLPGKVAPGSSGKIVADTIVRLLSQKNCNKE